MRAGAIAAALLVAGSSAHALTPVAQDRHVYGKHRISSSVVPIDVTFEETFAAPDDSPFSATTNGAQPGATIPAPPPFPSVPFSWSDIASQISTIEPEALHASGSSLANPGASTDFQHQMQSESVYSVDFVLDEERAFALTGQIDLAFQNDGYPDPDSLIPCSSSTARITLTGPGGLVAEVARSHPPGGFPPPEECWQSCEASLPLSASGVLAPGSYRLEARSQSSGTGGIGAHSVCDGSATGSYTADLQLAPTVPALPLPWSLLLGLALLWTARRKS